MRKFLILDKKYNQSKVIKCTIKGIIESNSFPSLEVKDKERYPEYYGCDVVEVTENCHIDII